jgi:hypothetical protein
LLSVVAISIFYCYAKAILLSKKQNYQITDHLYNYVNDYRNWADFGSWTTEARNKVLYQATIGKGAYYSWEGKDGTGEVRTLLLKKMIVFHKMNYSGTSSNLSWSLKILKVELKSHGNQRGMSFLLKFYTALNGGVEEVMEKCMKRA